METARDHIRLFVIYAVLGVALLVVMHRDLRPLPVYQGLAFADEPALSAFAEGEPVSVRFRAPAKDLDGLYFLGMIYHELHRVRVRVENLSRGTTLSDEVWGKGDKIRFAGDNAVGDELEWTLQWERDAPPNPFSAFEVTAGGVVHTITLGEPIQLPPKEWIEVPFAAPADGIEGLRIAGLTSSPLTRVNVEFLDRTEDKPLKVFSVRDGEPAERAFDPVGRKGDALVLRLSWQPVPPPALRRAVSPEQVPLEVRVGGESTEYRPCFLAQYAWPTFRLVWLWVPAGLLVIMALARKSWIPAALVGCGLAAVATSHLSWQQTYGVTSLSFDPDRFAQNAHRLASWIRDPASRAGHELFWGEWRYSWIPLTPLLLAVQNLAGIPMPLAYGILVALASFGVVLTFHALLRHELKLPEAAAFLGTVLLIGHHFFLKAYGKPSTDPLSLLLLLLSLLLVARRARHAIPKETVWLATLIFLQFLARPPGLAYMAFIIGAALLADLWRERRLRPVARVQQGLLLALPSLVLYGGLFLFFGWGNNFATARLSAAEFLAYATPRRLGIMLVSMLQVLPLFWLGIRVKEAVRLPAVWLLGLWFAFFFVLLWVVDAPFLTRLVLPAIFFPVALTALGVANLQARNRVVGWGAVVALLVLAAGNVGIVIYHAGLAALPEPPWSEYIYH